MNKTDRKNILRNKGLAYRQTMTNSERWKNSQAIIEALFSHLQNMPDIPSCLLAYRSLPSEVNTETLFRTSDYRIFAPITHHHEQMEWRLVKPDTGWENGRFGVSEPVSDVTWTGEKTTVLLCPLTAFDRQGNRLGMGKGCFDHWLARHRHQLNHVIGLAFSGQEVADIPAERHDAPMDYIITEKEVIKCPKP
ncbi:MAG: 5-formyltetrahydrofolate cyclo-ligase [Mariprofundus sp.]